MNLVKVEPISSAVHHLRHNDKYISAATDNEVNLYWSIAKLTG